MEVKVSKEMNKSVIIITCILGVLILIYISTPSGYEQELLKYKQKEKIYLDSIKSIHVQYNLLIEHDRIIYTKFKRDSVELITSKKEAIRNYKLYLHEKNTKRNFISFTIDSLLSIVPSR